MNTIPMEEQKKLSPTLIFSLVAAIGTILVAGGVTMWAIIAEPPGDTVGKAFITVFLAAAFAFALIGEVRVDRKENFVTLGRVTALVLIIASGLYLTWNQVDPYPWADFWEGDFGAWLGVVILLEGIVATLILFWPAMVKNMKNKLVRYTFNGGLALVILAALLISLAWTTWDNDWPALYWRWVLAISVLALVFFTIPLVVSMILAPKKPKQIYQYPAPVQYTHAPETSWEQAVAETRENAENNQENNTL